MKKGHSKTEIEIRGTHRKKTNPYFKSMVKGKREEIIVTLPLKEAERESK